MPLKIDLEYRAQSYQCLSLFIQRASPAFLGAEDLFIVQIELADHELAFNMSG
jgi:hypothetical protein